MNGTVAADRHVLVLARTGPPTATIDLREIRPRDRPARVFSAFRGLEEEQALHLASDQSLEPFYFEFVVETPDAFHWEYLETGPAIWRADVTRLKADPAHAGRGASPDQATWRAEGWE